MPARLLEIEATVRLLSDGRFRSESFGQPWYSGETAVLQAANVTLVVGSRPVSLFDRAFFLAHGQNPRRFDLVVVKSPHCESHMFADWCAKLINVDAPVPTVAVTPALIEVEDGYTLGKPMGNGHPMGAVWLPAAQITAYISGIHLVVISSDRLIYPMRSPEIFSILKISPS